MEESCDKKSRLIHQLEGQQVVEAKALLDKIKQVNDLTGILTDQIVPCQTDVQHSGGTRILALVKSNQTVGLGPVFLTQVREKRS